MSDQDAMKHDQHVMINGRTVGPMINVARDGSYLKFIFPTTSNEFFANELQVKGGTVGEMNRKTMHKYLDDVIDRHMKT